MFRRSILPLGVSRLVALSAALLLTGWAPLRAQVVVVPTTPQVGSSNPATAEPAVSRPETTPCVVELFQNLKFADFSNKTFSYAPPSACPGPWAKVVFTADFTVTAGRQFDRTASFYLGHANIYYGTTAEPRKTLSPSWHVERDVTDLSAIFKSAQSGQADLGNFVGVSGGVTYDGIIYASAALMFYPASREDRAPVVPDVVVPVNGPGGDAGTLNTTSSEITQTLNLPTNVERVYLDVIAQSQSNDEFWYFCVPSDVANNLQTCGNTAFRETEVTIDGQPAGVAPVFPWIYTGGIDPYLWEPIPAIQTLNFKPYRVDLTPFAGVLSDGNAHTIGISVYNANNYFLATANVLAYTDHGRRDVDGGLISNTLTLAPTPVVNENIATDPNGPTYTGSVTVASNRGFAIRGYVNTSHGRVETTVEQKVDFLSNQQFDVNGTTDKQNLQQASTVDSHTTTREGFLVNTIDRHISYPLNIDFSFVVNPDGSLNQTTTVDQKDMIGESRRFNGFEYYRSKLRESVMSTDALNYDAAGKFLGPSGSATTQTYSFKDSRDHCYSRTITAAAQKLTSVSDGQGCKGDDHDREDDDH